MQTGIARTQPKTILVVQEIRKHTLKISQLDKATNLHTVAPASRRRVPLVPQ